MLQKPAADVSLQSSSFSTCKQLLTQSSLSLRALAEPLAPLKADQLPASSIGMLTQVISPMHAHFSILPA